MAKFVAMTAEQIESLKDGDRVVASSGKAYQVVRYADRIDVQQVRNGKLYGKRYDARRIQIALPLEEPAPVLKEWKLSTLRERFGAGLTGANLFK